ncbi:MAG: hypothetical protein D6770_07035 [Anaerolineae bacterium]|nr:MAG: hypothetical protein D6770_07035 [Anaerolineae bacterium]
MADFFDAEGFSTRRIEAVPGGPVDGGNGGQRDAFQCDEKATAALLALGSILLLVVISFSPQVRCSEFAFHEE